MPLSLFIYLPQGDEKHNGIKTISEAVPLELCVTKSPDSYKISPIGCHEFKEKIYSFKLGSIIALESTSQWFSGSIYSPKKIDDLQVKVNGGSNKNVKVEEKMEGSNVVYLVKYLETPGSNVKFTFFSYGFIFEPSEFTFTVGSDCETDQGFNVVAKKSHLIKGKLSIPLGEKKMFVVSINI